MININKQLKQLEVINKNKLDKYFNLNNNYQKELSSFLKLSNISYEEFLNNRSHKFRYFCYCNIKHLRMLKCPKQNFNSQGESVLIVLEEYPHIEFIIRNALDKLGDKWKHTIVCSNVNYNQIVNINKIINTDLNIIIFNSTDRNKLLKSKNLWNKLTGGKILIYSENTCFFKKHGFNKFLKWNYIGAPFAYDEESELIVGSGNLSLRTKKFMLEIIDKIKIIPDEREDLYFLRGIKELKLFELPSIDEANLFSSRHIFNEHCFGVDNFWETKNMINIEYHISDKIIEPIKNYPEIKKFYELTLFHKFALGLSIPYSPIDYELIQRNYMTKFNKDSKLYAHLHCFNINDFFFIYEKYFSIIKMYFNIIITYSLGDTETLESYDITILKIPENNLNIGAKFCVTSYLNDNNIDYDYIFFLNSNNDIIRREMYFDSIITNLNDEFINNIKNNDAYFPDLNSNIQSNNDYHFLLCRKNLLCYLNVEEQTDNFLQSNVFILSKKIINIIYSDALLYNILNKQQDINIEYFKQINKLQQMLKNNTNINRIPDSFKKNYINECLIRDSQLEDVIESIIINLCNNPRKLNIIVSLLSFKNISQINNNNIIKYQIVKENNKEEYLNNKLWAHLHCYDINEFYRMYENHIDSIIKNFSVIITYSKGDTIPKLDVCVLNIKNKGVDIGAKFNCINYLNNKNIDYNHILFLHSKSNDDRRKQYFDGILNNLDVKKLTNNVGIYTIDIIVSEQDDWGRNNYHMRNIIKRMNLPYYSNTFPEGNIYILSKSVAEYMFDDRFDIYENLNEGNSFDYSWFINYYNDYKNLSYDKAYEIYKEQKLFGNNISTKKGWKGLADCQIEHVFERIPFGVCKMFNQKILISDRSDEAIDNFNFKIKNNIEINKETILIIACHTNSPEKIKYLVNNIKIFKKHINTIYIVNSFEFKDIVEPYFKDDNVIFNNILTDKLLDIYYNLFPDIKGHFDENDKEKIKQHYTYFGCKELSRNQHFKSYTNHVNINFEYTENTHLICHKKWYDCLKNLNLKNNFILTNDSFVLVNNIENFVKQSFLLGLKGIDMLGIIDSNENLNHLPDFLRIYSENGIKLWMEYYEKNLQNCRSFLDMIKVMEIGSSNFFKNKDSLFKVDETYKKNIHFDDELNKKFICELNYPIIKIKRLQFTDYKNHPILNKFENKDGSLPSDFCPKFYKSLHIDLKDLSDEDAKIHFIRFGIDENRQYINIYYYFPDFDPEIYKSLHPDLVSFNLNDCEKHFLTDGIKEGRKYNKNQKSIYPDFMKFKLNNLNKYY
jgi:hypothetical protein